MELDELVADIAWSEFEIRNDGTIYIKYTMGIPALPVYMRVGLYMRKPMQVLMAAGKYIRLRSAPGYGNHYCLTSLDPEHPETSLYPIQSWEWHLSPRLLWQPWDDRMLQAQTTQQMAQAAMQQAQYAQAQQLAQHTLLHAQQLAAQAQYMPAGGLWGQTTNNTSGPPGPFWPPGSI